MSWQRQRTSAAVVGGVGGDIWGLGGGSGAGVEVFEQPEGEVEEGAAGVAPVEAEAVLGGVDEEEGVEGQGEDAVAEQGLVGAKAGGAIRGDEAAADGEGG
jgi:hypothetical protein